MRIALVIPNYNHQTAIAQTLEQLDGLGLPCYLVNDGSNDETRFLLTELAKKYSWVTLLHHPFNRGKGAAVMTGLRTAYQDGYSHALQVDADGQHNLDDIPAMIARAESAPESLISGLPQYDESVPKGRLYGRYLTHIWVWIETLSFDIQDSMCGFRVYPLAETEKLFLTHALGERMDFDIEVLVRLYWQGVPVIHIPTRVIYPEDGISHFQGIKDNARISLMHSKLFFSMLLRQPKRLWNKFSQSKQSQHWSNIQERGSYWGIKVIAESYRYGGHWLCRAVMYPVICYFFLTGATARKASQQFLTQVKTTEPKHPLLSENLSWRDNLKHFFTFGNAALDRIDAWCNRIKLAEVDFPNRQLLVDQLKTGKGAVLLVSHLGNLELCRAISIHQRKVKVNVMVLTEHAENFNRVLQQLNPDSALNLIQVTELGPSTSILLQQKIDAGELVVIAGDRTSSQTAGRVIYQPFLGKEAPFPQGPFILAGLLDCPVFTMFCLREEGRYHVHLRHFANSLKGPRAGRAERLENAVQDFSQRLEYFALRQPLQWFNFYDFWHKDENIQRTNVQGSKGQQHK
ncbi:glycosyltransferase family 2 protein [Shewanella sp. KX20019]|uniref:glycosyltransferase family 2 protein n=1 Tax=Shewanella sp. KX20019 TaxID=2803864 RepID=UPI001925DEFC|nr:glycosyltransferase family 2 protein [Shewanella sp. KX20019]QQX79887.1 glycosyltransferase family 2 protein [Shewanella sp. KX20019]